MDPKQLINQANELLCQANPTLVDLENIIRQIIDFQATKEYSKVSSQDKEALDNSLYELDGKIEELKQDTGPVGVTPPGRPQLGSTDDSLVNILDDAEDLFYAFKYKDAIRKYEEFLQAAPNTPAYASKRQRAQSDLNQAQDYLRTGNFPDLALPPGAGRVYGQAQSAFRREDYKEALRLIDDAIRLLEEESGIHRWDAGNKFRDSIQKQLDAQELYEDGQKIFQDGKFDQAINKVTEAGKLSGRQSFADKAVEMRAFKSKLSEVLGVLPPVGERTLDSYIREAAGRVNRELDGISKSIDTASKIEDARAAVSRAEQKLADLRFLGMTYPNADKLQKKIDDLANFETELDEANQAYNRGSRIWPSHAHSISKNIRTRFPSDPEVAKLNQKFAPYRAGMTLLWLIAALAILIPVGLGINYGYDRYKAISLAKTPSPTPTATYTPTFTPSPTITATPLPTSTLTPSPTPTITATPPYQGWTIMQVWARNGCYTSYTATGRIPADSVVIFLSIPERQFDELNRECVLVQYQGDTSVIGWILLEDIRFTP